MYDLLCCCFFTFKIYCMLPMILNFKKRFGVILLCFLQSILYFWKLKNQILFKKRERFFKRLNQYDCRFNCLLKVTQNFNSMFTIQIKNHSLQNKHFSFFRFLIFFGLDTSLNYPGLQVYQTYQTVWNLPCLPVFRYFCKSPSL